MGHSGDFVDEGHDMSAGLRDHLEIVGEDVWLTVPPFSEYLRTVRLVAADAAVRAGLDMEEVEDFRIAVDELCHLLISSTDHEISISFGVVGTCAVARGRARRRDGAPLPRLEELSETIVRSVSDFHETIDRPTEIVFAVLKQARPTDEPA
jgi:hypothetical protein